MHKVRKFSVPLPHPKSGTDEAKSCFCSIDTQISMLGVRASLETPSMNFGLSTETSASVGYGSHWN